jgi:pimeloyl-ACP methyl ester carboxylesterase
VVPGVEHRQIDLGEVRIHLAEAGHGPPLRLALDPRPTRNVSVESIEGAGHFLPEEVPEEVIGLAGPFLSD